MVRRATHRFVSSRILAIPSWFILTLADVVGCSDDGSGNGPGGGGSVSAGGTNLAGTGSFGSGGSGTDGQETAAGGLASGTGGVPGVGGSEDSTRLSVPLTETGEAFDLETGRMNVHLDEFLSAHDVVYRRPNNEALLGLPVGNGRVGAMVWEEGGLMMQVGNVDSSPQSTYGCGNVKVSTVGGFQTGGSYEQRLIFHEASLRTTYGDGTVVTILGAAGSEMLGIHIEDARAQPGAVTVDLSMWDVNSLPDAGEGSNIPAWQTVTSFAEGETAGISRGQSDSNKFGVTLAAKVQGANATAETVANNHARLRVTGASSYTVWVSCASRLNALDHDSVTEAKTSLAEVVAAGYEQTVADYHAFWHDFWKRSYVEVKDSGDADYFTSAYYLSTYMIAAGAFGNYPMHFINGVFRATQDKTKWSHAYWHWNQRDVYNSFLVSNHPEMMKTFNNVYLRNTAVLKQNAQNHWGIDGIWAPETMAWDGNADPSIYSDYTKGIHSTGTEAALNMIDYARYTGDLDYLKETAYPFMREVVKFYVAILSHDDGSNTYHMETSHAHETYWNVRNAITDLAAIRALFPIAIQLSREYGVDADLRSTWQNVLDRLVAYPTGNGAYLPHQVPIAQSRNNENVACEVIWPFDQTGIGATDYNTAVETWNVRPFPYGNVWSNDAIQAARLGLGTQTFQGLRTMLQRYQNYPNGMTTNTNGVFEYLGVHLIALNEALLQSHDGRIRVFPALPDDSSQVARFMLLAKGATLVSSEMEGGVVKYVGLRSLAGNPVTLINPWPGANVRVIQGLGGTEVLTTSENEISFPTQQGVAYAVERADTPLSSFEFAHVTGQPNQGAKHLNGTDSNLGMNAP